MKTAKGTSFRSFLMGCSQIVSLEMHTIASSRIENSCEQFPVGMDTICFIPKGKSIANSFLLGWIPLLQAEQETFRK